MLGTRNDTAFLTHSIPFFRGPGQLFRYGGYVQELRTQRKEEVVALEANAKRFRETIYGHKHNAEKQRIPSFPAKHPQEQQPIPSDKGKGGQDPKSQNQMAPCIIHNKRVRLPILPINRGISGKIDPATSMAALGNNGGPSSIALKENRSTLPAKRWTHRKRP